MVTNTNINVGDDKLLTGRTEGCWDIEGYFARNELRDAGASQFYRRGKDHRRFGRENSARPIPRRTKRSRLPTRHSWLLSLKDPL